MARDGIARSRVACSGARLDWESRYDGRLVVARIDGVAWAGISGPWPDGHYALTWWPAAAGGAASGMEFYSSMEAARNRIAHSLGNAVSPPRGMRCMTAHVAEDCHGF